MKLNEKIKYYRKDLNLTQQELADLSGISLRALSNYEKGLREPSMEVLIRIAKALMIPVNNLKPQITKSPEIEYLFAGTGKLMEGLYGKYFAEIENKNEEEINLLYNLLKIRYGEENITMNRSIDSEFIELNIGDKTIIYTKQEFEKFIDHVSTLFPTFKMILDSSKIK